MASNSLYTTVILLFLALFLTPLQSSHGVRRRTTSRKLVNIVAPSSIYNPDGAEPPSEVVNCKVQVPNVCRIKQNKHRALADDAYRWPKGIVPYEIEDSIRNASISVMKKLNVGQWKVWSDKNPIEKAISKAMTDLEAQTCIRFVPRTSSNHDYIAIVLGSSSSPDLCWSLLGRWGGRQEVTLGAMCGSYKGVVIHELMHALGFEHEQSRLDRNDYIRINWDNIDPEETAQFEYKNGSCGTQETKLLSSGYSFTSIMHYGEYAFSHNKKKTIEILEKHRNAGAKLGQRTGLDTVDINRVRELYQCDDENQHSVVEAVAHACHRKGRYQARHNETVRSNGYVYRCNAASHFETSYVPLACLSGSGYEAGANETFIDGSVMRRCEINGLEISDVPVACVDEAGRQVDVGQQMNIGGQEFVCAKVDEDIMPRPADHPIAI